MKLQARHAKRETQPSGSGRDGLGWLDGCSNKRKIEVFLNATEVADPDLIEFWAIDSSSPIRQDTTDGGSTTEQDAKRAWKHGCVGDPGGGVWDFVFPEEPRRATEASTTPAWPPWA